MTWSELEGDVAILVCAVGAGVAAVLASPIAAAALALVALALTFRPTIERIRTMNPARATRPIPLALTALVAVFSALVALAIAGGHDAHATSAAHRHTGPPAGHSHHLSPKQVAFHDGMRRLWEDHIVWTRLAIISLTTDAPDTEATVGRLLQNQTDIGNAVKPFYGEEAGNALTAELRKHILIAAEVIAAARAEDADALADAQVRWSANAHDIAVLLNSVNPRNWPLDILDAEMAKHLDLTTAEVVARLGANWDEDVAAYDAVHEHILHMADLLSDGIVAQFPKRFR
jgi:hypothetical protein